MSASVLFDLPGPRARRRYRIVAVASLVAIALALWWMVGRFAAKGNFDAEKWSPFAQPSAWVDYLLPGLGNTLKGAGIAIVLAGVFGLLFGMGRLSHNRLIRWACTAVVEFFRSVPVLVMMMFTFYFCIFNLAGVVPGSQAPLIGVVTGLTLYNGSVVAELIRSGVGSLPKGQREAGYAIGLTPQQTLRTILLPQAITAMLPALVGQLVVVLKDTAIGFVACTYAEMLRAGDNVGSAFGNPVPAMIVVAVLYIVLNYALTSLAGYLEGRLREKGRPTIAKGTIGPAVVDTAPVEQARHQVDDEVLREHYHRSDRA